MATDTPVHLYQIAYSPASQAQIPAGWLQLENLDNPRPDWYEYWPIRRHLLSQTLIEDAYYGFFSPKFCGKTGLALEDVRQFVASHAERADVLLFSPQPDMGAFFLNVFEQAEAYDAGHIQAFEDFLESIGRRQPLRTMVMDTRQIAFSNYFVARPAFWREWLELNERLFAVCEGPDSPLRQALCKPTTYPAPGGGTVQRKVFIMERTVSLLLATQPRWRTVAHDPYRFGWSASRLSQHRVDAVISDALKLAYREQPFPEYFQAFYQVRKRLREATSG